MSLGLNPHPDCTSCSCSIDNLSPGPERLSSDLGWVWPISVTRGVLSRSLAKIRIHAVRGCFSDPLRGSIHEESAFFGTKHVVPSHPHGGSRLDSCHPSQVRVHAGVLRSLVITTLSFYLAFGSRARTLLSVNVEGHGFLASARERLAKSRYWASGWPNSAKKPKNEQELLEFTVAID